MYESLIQVIRQEAPSRFEKGARGRKGAESFNVTAFVKQIWGDTGDRNQWMRIINAPQTISFEELIKVCEALGLSFPEFVAELQSVARRIERDRKECFFAQSPASG